MQSLSGTLKNLPQLVHKKLIEAKECKRGKISGVCITADGIAVLTACGVDTTAVKLEPQVATVNVVGTLWWKYWGKGGFVKVVFWLYLSNEEEILDRIDVVC